MKENIMYRCYHIAKKKYNNYVVKYLKNNNKHLMRMPQ